MVSTDAEVSDEHRALACHLTGVPDGTRIHFLVVHAPGEPSGKLLFVHFFERTGKVLERRMRPGNLGVSLFSYAADDLDGLRSTVEAAGAVIETPPTAVGERGTPHHAGPRPQPGAARVCRGRLVLSWGKSR